MVDAELALDSSYNYLTQWANDMFRSLWNDQENVLEG